MLDLCRARARHNRRAGCSVASVHIVIMGCGRVGSTLTHSLEQRGHTTAVIDSNPDAFRRLGTGFAGITVTGMGFDRDVLRRGRHRAGRRLRRGLQRRQLQHHLRAGGSRAVPGRERRRPDLRPRPRPGLRAARRPHGRHVSPGPPTRCCAASCRPAPSRPGATSPATCDSTGSTPRSAGSGTASPISRPPRASGSPTCDVWVSVSSPSPTTVIQEGDFLSVFMLENTADSSHAVLDAGPEAR